MAEAMQEAVEKVANEEPKPDWYETGIKYKNGVPHYRCKYWCKNENCKNKGNHYIPLDAETINCHNCGQSLKVRLATGNFQDVRTRLPERDQYGNFYRADIAE
ncbi:hypothetical protein [Paenibacillus senegalensis]|uniref:hypothetical protein n=1 Tax=Paenibacillus senegalensis TaxID=1465766 RepID=UPI0002885F01|nr:hypothetical protein [Paenibacillus senegalensis]